MQTNILLVVWRRRNINILLRAESRMCWFFGIPRCPAEGFLLDSGEVLPDDTWLICRSVYESCNTTSRLLP